MILQLGAHDFTREENITNTAIGPRQMPENMKNAMPNTCKRRCNGTFDQEVHLIFIFRDPHETNDFNLCHCRRRLSYYRTFDSMKAQRLKTLALALLLVNYQAPY